MRVWLPLCLLTTLVTGCSICPPGYLDDYATVGGRYQRLDPTTGRVGSAFSDPGTQEVQFNDYYADEYSAPVVEEPYMGEVYDQSSLPGESVMDSNSQPAAPPNFEMQDGIILESVEAEPEGAILQGSGAR